MPKVRIFDGPRRPLSKEFRSGVCLHGHTLHSRESFSIVGNMIRCRPRLDALICRARAKAGGPDHQIDFNRLWWTPPASARQAVRLEADQIERGLGLDAIVSLSDHDNIDGPLRLQVGAQPNPAPISVEWTVPYAGSRFHIGIHNLPPETAVATVREMNAFTAQPSPPRLRELLDGVTRSPQSLVIFNHPMWDQDGIGAPAHETAALNWVRSFRPFVHGVEVNGLRSRSENRRAAQLAEAVGLPIVSGGDRHALEPAGLLNLSRAATFAEFSDEIRSGSVSHIVEMPQYRLPLKLRIARSMGDILRDHPEHSLGWVHWSDRFFYKLREGVSPVADILPYEPWLLRLILQAVRVVPSWPRPWPTGNSDSHHGLQNSLLRGNARLPEE